MSDINVVERIQSAITAVQEARGVPLSASAVIHRGEMLTILGQAAQALPSDLASAQSLLAKRDTILEEARKVADSIIAEAREEVSLMIEQTQIVTEARREAARILDEVEEKSRQEREEIEAYIDGRLATLEVVLNKTLDVIQRGRDKLQGNEDMSQLSELAE